MRKCRTIKLVRAHIRKYGTYSGKSFDEVTKLCNDAAFEEMFSVDYSQAETFACELSFTTLDWILMMKIINDRTYDFSNITEDQRL